jgi:hypothetical protein
MYIKFTKKQEREREREREKNMTRFGFLDGCQHSRRRKSGSNCVGFNLPTRHEIFILMSPTTLTLFNNQSYYTKITSTKHFFIRQLKNKIRLKIKHRTIYC